MAGARLQGHHLVYPRSELALRHGAGGARSGSRASQTSTDCPGPDAGDVRRGGSRWMASLDLMGTDPPSPPCGDVPFHTPAAAKRRRSARVEHAGVQAAAAEKPGNAPAAGVEGRNPKQSACTKRSGSAPGLGRPPLADQDYVGSRVPVERPWQGPRRHSRPLSSRHELSQIRGRRVAGLAVRPPRTRRGRSPGPGSRGRSSRRP
jgi:hypothetical protein